MNVRNCGITDLVRMSNQELAGKMANGDGTTLYGAKILSWGRGLPERTITNDDLSKIMDTNDEWIIQRTGIKERRIADVDNGENAISLGSKAILAALKNSQKYSNEEIKAEDLDLIICATATGDYLFPATACMIQANIGASKAVAFDISAACTGFIYALNLAYNFIKIGQYKKIAVVAVDLMSRFIDWSDRRTAVIFGDGAGAAILSATDLQDDSFNPFYLRAEGDTKCSLYVPNVGNKYPRKAEEITDKPVMVYMDGQSVYQFAVKAVPEALDHACKLASINPNEIDYVVPHQANFRIIESAAKRLGIPVEKFICNIDRYGNTSAASIPIAFDEALELGTIKHMKNQKQKFALVGFGAGLTWGSVIIEF